MTPTIQTTTTSLQLMARHAVRCSPCCIKARRLLEVPPHLERMELLCAIEWCCYRATGRKLHS